MKLSLKSENLVEEMEAPLEHNFVFKFNLLIIFKIRKI
jgi:hypothetical protein